MRLDRSCHFHQLAVVAEQFALKTFQDVCHPGRFLRERLTARPLLAVIDEAVTK
jgi:hypothetical protein